MSEAGFLARFRRARPALQDREEPTLLPRKRATPSQPSTASMAVDQARRQARQRLIGAGVLLLLGVIAFPVVFETQPRPVVPPDLPMRLTSEPVAPEVTQTQPLVQREIPSRPASAQTTDTPPGSSTGAEPVSEPAAGASALTTASTTAEAVAPAPPVSAAQTPSSPADTTERLPDPAAKRAPVTGTSAVSPPQPAGSSAVSAGAPALASTATATTASAASAASAASSTPAPSSTSSTSAAPAASAARESPAAPAAAPRFIVQVGAFADAGSVRSLRARIERLGLSTYTQAVDTSAGRRIRVRMGPYESREDANRALEKLQQSGVSGGMVLTL